MCIRDSFKALKTKKESLLDPDVMNALIDEVKDPEFDKSKFQCSERNKELFKYVFPKLSNKLKTLCCNAKGTQNGLEVVRLIIREHDPTGENIATGLEQRFTNKLRQGKCKTLEASRNKAKELEKAIIEFRERTGEPLNDRLQSTVMLGIVDEETAIAMEAKETNSSDFKTIKDFIETRYINKLARKIDIGEQPDKDLSMMGAEGAVSYTHLTLPTIYSV